MPSPLEIIRQNTREITPLPTGTSSKLSRIDGTRYLAWDIYGTLLISSAGSLGPGKTTEQILRNLLSENEQDLPTYSLETHLFNLIEQNNALSRKENCSFPEIEIREIWNLFFNSLSLNPPEDLDDFALRYELATNPVWPMPGAQDALTHPATLGLVSNAQFYTPLILEAFGLSIPEKATYSFELRHAKPGTAIFSEFLKDGPPPEEILYIGNDLLSDIAPAHQLGMRTALFAGDQRSYRPRHGRSDLPQPDAIVTSLAEIPLLLAE